jgi:hypothetical protein
MVEAPNEDGVTEQYTDSEGIVRGCIWENKRRFRQTEGTPFMQEPLRTRVRYLGIGPGAQDILNGTFQCPANTPPYAARRIQGLKRIDGTHEEPIHAGTPTEEFCQGWKRAKEKTSAKPSTLHFGHCKAGALDPRIIEFEAAMASIPMKSGYAYKRWRKGTDVELLKKGNSFHVSKLRTIVLFEADFNFTNKAVGKKEGRNKGQSTLQNGKRARRQQEEASRGRNWAQQMLNNGPTATAQMAQDTMFQRHEELLWPHHACSPLSVPPTTRNSRIRSSMHVLHAPEFRAYHSHSLRRL